MSLSTKTESMQPKIQGRDPRQVAMLASLSVSFLMLVGKLTAYFVTTSAAILSDAMESVVHLLATAFVGFSLWYAIQPADEAHPYGHGKVAYFSSGFEGSMILVAALAILYSSVRALIIGPELRQLDVGLIILVGLTLVNLGLGYFLIRTGRRHNSLVLISNGRHVLTDMWTSLGVIVGLTLVWMTEMAWLDPVVAILVALNILWTAINLLKGAVEGLMEKAEPKDTEVILAELENAVEEELISGFHQLRHRRVNDQLWVEYHLHFPGTMSLTEAHRRAHLVEDAVAARYAQDQVHVTAHLEPEAHREAHSGQNVEPADPLGRAGRKSG